MSTNIHVTINYPSPVNGRNSQIKKTKIWLDYALSQRNTCAVAACALVSNFFWGKPLEPKRMSYMLKDMNRFLDPGKDLDYILKGWVEEYTDFCVEELDWNKLDKCKLLHMAMSSIVLKPTKPKRVKPTTSRGVSALSLDSSAPSRRSAEAEKKIASSNFIDFSTPRRPAVAPTPTTTRTAALFPATVTTLAATPTGLARDTGAGVGLELVEIDRKRSSEAASALSLESPAPRRTSMEADEKSAADDQHSRDLQALREKIWAENALKQEIMELQTRTEKIFKEQEKDNFWLCFFRISPSINNFEAGDEEMSSLIPSGTRRVSTSVREEVEHTFEFDEDDNLITWPDIVLQFKDSKGRHALVGKKELKSSEFWAAVTMATFFKVFWANPKKETSPVTDTTLHLLTPPPIDHVPATAHRRAHVMEL